jgi:four helix bundle protein
MHKRGIDDRAGAFFEDVVVFTQTISSAPGTLRTIEQLVSAAGSVPANRCEATEGSSRREFIRFNKLALRGARESVVWLRGCQAGRWGNQDSCARLLDEADQLIRILTAIVKNSRRDD